jgi:tight adherence protein B
MSPPPLERALALSGAACFVLGLAALAPVLLKPSSWTRRAYAQQVARYDRELRLCFLPSSGRLIVGLQLGACALALTGAVALAQPAGYALAVGALLLPGWWLGRRRRWHVAKLEAQLDTFIVGLANALKAVPSPAAALAHLTPVLPLPLRLEIERLLGDVRVGSTLEQALLGMAARIHSPDVESALSALLIGLQAGGNLPQVLENSAATMREMSRLEGVVRTKTSEARAQLWVLGGFPYVLAFGFHAVDPEYFVPLQSGLLGGIILTVAVAFWLAALLAARRILKVDI